MAGIRVILTDIEGTTSSLSFVKEVLFPYARKRMAAFVREHSQQPQVKELLDSANQEAGGGLSQEQLVACLVRWIDEDRKVTSLKALQGLIWEQGYREDDFKGHMYEDAVAMLRRWHYAGISLYVYSSGSVQAQRLLFAHTEFGDLTPLFSGYFDTRVGGKREAASYRNILQHIGAAGESVLFLSDVAEELDAAEEAGMHVLQLVRDDDVTRGRHRTVGSFSDIDLESFSA